MQRGEMFIVSAPSAAGKTTLIRRLMATPLATPDRLVYSVSHTTRAPRDDEVDGRDYHFIAVEEFRRRIDEDAFLEWADVYGDYKGTARAEVERHLAAGVDVLLDLDVQGAVQVLERHPEAHAIFILPPDFAEMRRRLHGRGHDGAEQIRRRLDVSLWEIEFYERYGYVIINDDLDSASQALAAIILDKRHRVERMRDRVQEILTDFRTHLGAEPASEPRTEDDP